VGRFDIAATLATVFYFAQSAGSEALPAGEFTENRDQRAPSGGRGTQE